MLTRILTTAGVLAALTGPAARADIMHWYWEVEVNGETVDASRPVVVEAGDKVLIDLSASWTPRGDGFAWSWFSISAGDEFFDSASEVNISESDGLGRNRSLSALSDENGTFTDTNGSDSYDLIDWIDVGQLSRHFGHFDDSHPMPVYSLLWELDRSLDSTVTLERTDVVVRDQERFQIVYVDEWGNEAQYSHAEDQLVFVPEPGSLAVLLVTATAIGGRRR